MYYKYGILGWNENLLLQVARINLTFTGAKATGANKYLKVGIESSGDFQGRSNGKVYNFMTRALTLTHEYNIESGMKTISIPNNL